MTAKIIHYDNNGNLTDDGVNAYTWDRANRMLTAPGNTAYTYDGVGNRVSQTVNSVLTEYLLDTQPGLTKVIGDSDGNRFLHSPRGIHAQYDGAGNWTYAMQDALGNVRSEVDSLGGIGFTQDMTAYLTPTNQNGAGVMPFGATGEQMDDNGLLYLRARYYDPSRGMFPSLDPFEGMMQRPMSLNGYSWVEGNPINMVDPTGHCAIPIGACIASLGFFLDNLGGIGFAIDGAACGWALSCAGAATLVAAVASALGPDMANTLADILGVDGVSTGAGQSQPPNLPNNFVEDIVNTYDLSQTLSDYLTNVTDFVISGTSTVSSDNNPDRCNCPTPSAPTSTIPFAGGEDMLCHLNCNNGGIPHAAFRLLQTRGVDLQLLSAPSGQVNGVFLYPGQYPEFMGGLDADIQTLFGGNAITSGGGTIVVRQAGETVTQATRLATLVEEITHASLYHGLIPGVPSCNTITALENEYIAKTAKLAWMTLSGIPFSAFSNAEVSDLGGAVQATVANPGARAFNPCPSGNASSSLGQTGVLAGLECTDPYVRQTVLLATI